MKKLLLLCLVLLGGVMQVSAAWPDELYLICSENNNWAVQGDAYNSTFKFTKTSEYNFRATVPGSYIHSGNWRFRFRVKDNDWWNVGPNDGQDANITTGAYTTWQKGYDGISEAFVISKNTDAKYIRIYCTWNSSNNNFTVSSEVITTETTYQVTYTNPNSWDENNVKAYAFADGLVLTEDGWPGTKMTKSDNNYILNIKGLPNSNVIFNNNGSNKTDDLELVYNGVYNNSGVTGIKVSISSVGYATFSSTKSVDFSEVSNVDAYIASAITDDKVVLTKHNKVPNYNGVLLKGTAGTYNIPVTASPDAITTNYMMATVEQKEVAASTTGKYHYFLANGSNGIGFYNIASTQTSGAGKAYLETTTALTSTAGARVAWIFDNETTGIANVDVNANDNFNVNAPMYNLAGQRVNKSYKGVVIVNGKKMLNK